MIDVDAEPTLEMPEPWAERDPHDGVTETAGFVRVDGARLFCYAHVPVSPRGGVLLCPPILAESLVSYRLERLLADALSRDGFAVMRFHYRGSGHSEGAPERNSLDSHVEDALAASDALRTLALDPTAVVGTRIGGTVAAMASERLGIPRVGVIAPVFDGRTYFREIFRGHVMSEMRHGAEKVTVSDLERSMRDAGWVDILGYPLGRELHESIMRVQLAEKIVPPLREALFVQPEGAVADVKLPGAGHDVRIESRSVPGSPAWWFGGGSFRRRQEEEARVLTTDFIRGWINREESPDA